ncbi:MAG: type II CAAX endopeptidase family protein [Acidobacteriota bacterium]
MLDTPNEDLPAHRPEPTSKARHEPLLWLLLAAIVAMIVWTNLAFAPPAPEGADSAGPGDDLAFVFQGKYLVGAKTLFDSLGDAFAGQTEALTAGLGDLAAEPDRRLALVPVYAQLGEVDTARSTLEELRASDLEPPLSLDVETFAGLLDEPPRTPEGEVRGDFLERFGWFAELALARSGDGGAKGEILAAAQRLTLGVFLVFGLGLAAVLVGAVLLIFAAIGHAQGRLGSAYEAAAGKQPGHRVAYLESLILFLVALPAVGVLGIAFDGMWGLLLNWLVLPVALWPLVRGETLEDLRDALGLRSGDGVLREVGAGLVAYVAAMPILAVGLVATAVAATFVEQPPYHPIVDWVRDSGGAEVFLIYMLAALWAPLMEEAIFRGAFYHYLRGKARVFVSALTVSVVFAAIHPQGLVGIPFLTSLAVALALAREWRGSVIASVVMHMVHNGLAVTFMLSILR